MLNGSAKRSLIIVVACVVLLVVFGATYYLYTRRLAVVAEENSPVRGTVIQAIGNSITLRDFGEDGMLSDDDQTLFYALTADTVVRAPRADGRLVQTGLGAVYVVGALVVVRETADAGNGLVELRAADVLYTPPVTPEQEETP